MGLVSWLVVVGWRGKPWGMKRRRGEEDSEDFLVWAWEEKSVPDWGRAQSLGLAGQESRADLSPQVSAI